MDREINIRMANVTDAEDIIRVMEKVSGNMPHSDWFVAGGREYIETHIEENGFIFLAEGYLEGEEPELAGFFVVDIPGESEHNLGWDIGFDLEQCRRVVHMDTAVVAEGWRGLGLQHRLMQACEKELSHRGWEYLLATVHPDNIYSLNNARKGGYEVMATKEKYGGKLRHIMMKKLPMD